MDRRPPPRAPCLQRWNQRTEVMNSPGTGLASRITGHPIRPYTYGDKTTGGVGFFGGPASLAPLGKVLEEYHGCPFQGPDLVARLLLWPRLTQGQLQGPFSVFVLGRAIALYALFRVALNNIFEPTGYALTLHAAPAVAFLETTPPPPAGRHHFRRPRGRSSVAR
jgi:hypothetical protein